MFNFFIRSCATWASLALAPARLLAGPPTAPGLRLRIEPVFGAEPLVLETRTYPTVQNGPVTIATCRFYISALRLTYTDGSTYQEPRSYHLIDAEADSTFGINLPQAPVKPLKTLTFSIGVDSLANVSGAQSGDLEPGRGMYWAWHSGYINAKLEGRAPACPNPRHEFEFHIGGFQKPHSSLRHVVLTVPTGAAASPIVVQADVSKWLDGMKLAKIASVLVPGPTAQAVADAYATMFRIKP